MKFCQFFLPDQIFPLVLSLRTPSLHSFDSPAAPYTASRDGKRRGSCLGWEEDILSPYFCSLSVSRASRFWQQHLGHQRKVGTHFQDPALTLKLHPKCLSCLTLCLSLMGCMEQISLREEGGKLLFSTPRRGGGGAGGNAFRMEFYKSADWFVGVFQPPRAVIPGVARRHLQGKSFVWLP